MKPEEYQRLKKHYESCSDTELTSMMQEGKDAYQEGVFDLLCAEVKRRRLPEVMPAETGSAEDAGPEEIIFVVICTEQPEVIHKLAFELEEHGISTVMKHAGLVKLAVEQSQVEDAHKILEEFMKRESKGSPAGIPAELQHQEGMKPLDVLKMRRSVREYSDQEIPQDVLEQIVDAARFSPTARNVQPWEFVVVTQAPALHQLAGLAENGRFLTHAKTCIAVFCADTKYYLEDGCAATCTILSAAATMGIGSCWIAGDKKPYCAEVAQVLHVPASYKLVSLIALGYPASEEAFHLAEKRNMQELMHWERF